MRIAITGGTGFVGRHVAERFNPQDVVIVSRRTGYTLDSVPELVKAFTESEIVVHCAGINRELGDQTYERIHVQGTANVVEAAKQAGVKKIIFMSFLRARPNCGSPYHESKWAAEEIIRNSGLDYTILKAGMVYGLGDHMLDHLSHLMYTIPFVPTVGFQGKPIRPIPVEELVDVIVAAIEGRLTKSTVAVVGGEELQLSIAVKRIATTLGRNILVFPIPIWTQYTASKLFEATMKVPLAAKAQVRILTEGVSQVAPFGDELPDDLKPKIKFTREMILKGLPEPGRFTRKDLLFFK